MKTQEIDKPHSGRTTRIIDNAIQKLFKNGMVRFKDHVNYEGMSERHVKHMAKYVLNLVIRRLEVEHSFKSIYVEKLHCHIYQDGTIEVYLIKNNNTKLIIQKCGRVGSGRDPIVLDHLDGYQPIKNNKEPKQPPKKP